MINLYNNDGKGKVWRREGTANDLMHTSSSERTGSFVFIDYVDGERSKGWILKGKDYIICAGPKHSLKSTQNLLKQKSGMFCNGQINHLIWI